ncbi:MAG: DUF4743 domain-containing protein [Planctomycetota bacterium]
MTLSRWILTCNRHDLARFTPLWCDGRRVGYVRKDRIDDLLDLAVSLAGGDTDHPRLALRGSSRTERSNRLEELATRLAQVGRIRPVTGELYPVLADGNASCLATVDRALVAYLGVHARGVHLNGIVRRDSRTWMWIAERSRHKPTYPGMLDNMVAGGQPLGLTLRANLVKECAEEAGIPLELARNARSVGAVSYVYEDRSGLKPDTMFCFDLELPPDFVPRPVDGEVAAFHLMPIEDVAALVRDTDRFKFNCNLVILDFLVRHGWLDCDEVDYPELVSGLRRSLR